MVKSLRWWKAFILCLAATPALWLWFRALTDRLGANPAEALIRGLGEWTLIMLCLALAVTPLRRLTGRPEWMQLRRGLGLWTFAYAVQHGATYLWLDMGWSLSDTWVDIIQRPFILVGSLAVLLLVPLAATSFNGAIRALGAPRWKMLHSCVHAVAALAILHFFWMRSGKQDFDDVWLYAAVILVLWGVRAAYRWRPSTP